jgi:hypothetical protein
MIKKLLESLSFSQKTAESALCNQDISTAFQEALLCDWGDGVAAVEEALETAARLSHLHGSGMFFLTQESSATRATISILSILYTGVEEPATEGYWDKEEFAEPLLLKLMSEVLDRFLVSEERDGDLVDPKIWRSAGESGVKVALYCTAFASVVIELLEMIEAMKPGQFEKQKHDLFPLLCDLMRVQSEEIRSLVKSIMVCQVGPMIGVVPLYKDEQGLQ